MEEERKAAAKLAVETERLRGREEDFAAAEEVRRRYAAVTCKVGGWKCAAATPPCRVT